MKVFLFHSKMIFGPLLWTLFYQLSQEMHNSDLVSSFQLRKNTAASRTNISFKLVTGKWSLPYPKERILNIVWLLPLCFLLYSCDEKWPWHNLEPCYSLSCSWQFLLMFWQSILLARWPFKLSYCDVQEEPQHQILQNLHSFQ